MMLFTRLKGAVSLVGVLVLAVSPLAQSLTIQVDYTYDSSGFFGESQRAVMDEVASIYGNLISQPLQGISTPAQMTWSAIFNDPSTGNPVSLDDMSVAEDTLVVFAGARDLTGSTLGLGGFGGLSATGNLAFLENVSTRGVDGVADNLGFSTWGGALTFDSEVNWHFGLEEDGLDSNEFDFYSVALHEMGHLLGMGSSRSWQNLNTGGFFQGAQAQGAYGGAIPLACTDCPGCDACDAHFGNNVTGISLRDGSIQKSILTESLTSGERRDLTNVDAYALLDAAGWSANAEAIPEPTAGLLALVAGLFGFLCRRR